jgi:hypothetical protein
MNECLPAHANPCCGYVTNASSDVEDLAAGPSLPDLGDFSICLNCGALLMYSDPAKNVMRYATRLETISLSRQQKLEVAAIQRYIRRRGMLERERRRVQNQ